MQIDRHVEHVVEILAVQPFSIRARHDFAYHIPRLSPLLVDVAQLVTNRVRTVANFFQTHARRQPFGRQWQTYPNQ